MITAVPDASFDPKCLIREAYNIDGIGMAECKSIFLDWALSLPDGVEPSQALQGLLAAYGRDEAHPMTSVLAEGLLTAPAPRRRGRRARITGAKITGTKPSLA
ncbi:MAG: hypothetical protein AAGF71_13235 [Pseudomonadota bacterium]